MAKRRVDDIVLLHSPSKRLCRSRRLVDVQRRSPSPDGGVNSPSLLVLSASRSRKRSFYSEDFEVQTQEETSVGRKITRASPVLMERMSGCLSDRCRANSSPSCTETWPPADGTPFHTITPQIRDAADDHTQTDDCKYNSFQFWRSPVPALDLSLLEDISQPPEEDKSKGKDSCPAMEME